MSFSGRRGEEADLEQQNDSALDSLLRQVQQIKGLSQDIHEEVGDQNGLLDTMRSGIENAGSTVQKTMGALGTMFEAGGNKQMCYLVVGIVALFIILHYFISKVW